MEIQQDFFKSYGKRIKIRGIAYKIFCEQIFPSDKTLSEEMFSEIFFLTYFVMYSRPQTTVSRRLCKKLSSPSVSLLPKKQSQNQIMLKINLTKNHFRITDFHFLYCVSNYCLKRSYTVRNFQHELDGVGCVWG